MQMRAAHEPRFSAFCDHRAARYMGSFADEGLREMGVEGLKAVAMVDQYDGAIAAAAWSGHLDDTVARGDDGRTDVVDDVEPFVRLKDAQYRMHPQPKPLRRVVPFHRFQGREGGEIPLIIVILPEYLFIT